MSLDVAETTEVGSYFVSNYPPFSQWTREHVPELDEAFAAVPDRTVPLGLYLHIPFCRKRCKFCYFRVYTNQNAKAIERYVDALAREVELISQQPAVKDRDLKFVYFGGGTPSYLSSKQLRFLRESLGRSVTWHLADEVTFECEPGTLNAEKVQTLKDIGVTRVSLGVENFNDEILEENGRAHHAPEVFKAYEWIQQAGFPQVNVDLIAGMMGETDENWHHCIDQVLKLSPQNVTIYQMELPFNTLISKEMKEQGKASPVASWSTKRRWVSEAMDALLANGYHISSGNELVKDPVHDRFVYRDHLFRGSDILCAGVSSFGHFQGVHYQNVDQIEDYFQRVEAGELPVNRALRPTAHQRLIREFVLQMKEGRVAVRPLQHKFGVNVLDEFGVALENQQSKGYLTIGADEIVLTRKGLLQVDSLLTEYFEPEHRSVRYT
jgi:oxygen-independent coproporphyrinogen III oxidase